MPWVYIGTSPIKCAYVGTTPVKEIYVGTTKVRPTTKYVDFLLVGGGWAWGKQACSGWTWGWGWAWGVVICCNYELSSDRHSVIVGGWQCYTAGEQWYPSCFDSLVAYGGWGGGNSYLNGYYSKGSQWFSGASGGWGIQAAWGTGTQGCDWGCSWGSSFAWGWGGYSSAWLTPCCSKSSTTRTGGNGITNNFSGSTQYYAYWGGGWGCYCCSCWGTSPGGGGKGWGCSTGTCNWQNPTSCGSWGGGAWYSSGAIPSNWAGGIFILRYPTACWYSLTGGCKYTCWNYTIHCFTKSWAIYEWSVSGKHISYLVVWGWGWGCKGWGGGWEVLSWITDYTSALCVVVGSWGAKCWGGGGKSCLGTIVAKWGCGGTYKGGASWNWNAGGTCSGTANTCGWGGGWGASAAGENASWVRGWAWGMGTLGYWGGGWAWGCQSDTFPAFWYSGGANGGRSSWAAGTPTNCGWGWGGARCNWNCSSAGACWVVDVCYPADWSFGFTCATWGTKSLINWMCVHRFTSNGTFTIVS